jgi:hypothetical protein
MLMFKCTRRQIQRQNKTGEKMRGEF